ncbi:galaxin [Aplysia californica]|uniref:Galaxin n=1 Tax=Aplysia californica TaxID=6500 RepID=A0ABM1VQW5_APLCA|nr:galaxin [Aplysia californica]
MTLSWLQTYVGPTESGDHPQRRTIYSTKDNICCGDQVRNKYGDTWNKSDAEKVEHECCGGKLVPADDYICCFGNALRLSEKQKIDKDNLLCCSETVVVNIWEKICCGGVGFFISEGRSCCNGEPYLDSEKKCELIDDKETLILTSQGVCRSQIYSYREKSCCHGKLNNFPTVSSEPYDFACCDLKAYNRKEKYCCPANHTIPKNEELFCCGNGAYFSIINKNMSCCNGRPLIEGEELCCKNNTPCPKGKPDDDDCCISDGKMSTFCTSENEICTVRGVVKVEKGKLLCGDTVYDPNEEICCATRLAKRADGFNECCGFYTPYNSDKQIYS